MTFCCLLLRNLTQLDAFGNPFSDEQWRGTSAAPQQQKSRPGGADAL